MRVETTHLLEPGGHIMKNTDHHRAFLDNTNVLAVFTGGAATLATAAASCRIFPPITAWW
jgi:hypothetical protein